MVPLQLIRYKIVPYCRLTDFSLLPIPKNQQNDPKPARSPSTANDLAQIGPTAAQFCTKSGGIQAFPYGSMNGLESGWLARAGTDSRRFSCGKYILPCQGFPTGKHRPQELIEGQHEQSFYERKRRPMVVGYFPRLTRSYTSSRAKTMAFVCTCARKLSTTRTKPTMK